MDQNERNEIARLIGNARWSDDIDAFVISVEDLDAIRRLLGLEGDVMDSVDLGDTMPNEDMDGDHASALASAGFGTDEDYGYDGHEDLGWDGGCEE